MSMDSELCVLQKLSPYDGVVYYEMLKRIGRKEYDFSNPVHDMSFGDYKLWLKQQDDWSRGEALPQGYVPQICFWLMVGTTPVGLGKIRKVQTEQCLLAGGNIGYAIDSTQRRRGYGVLILKLLLEKAKEYSIEKALITVKKYNYASKRVAEINGATLIKETEDWWYFEVQN